MHFIPNEFNIWYADIYDFQVFRLGNILCTGLPMCCDQEHLPLTVISINGWFFLSQTWPLLPFFETRQWPFFLSPFFSLFSILDWSTLENFFFHTVPFHSNEPIVSENIQPSSSETEGSSSEELDPGCCTVLLHMLVKCGVSTPQGVCQEASIQAHHVCPVGS